MGYFSKEIPLNPDSSLGPVTIGSKIKVEGGTKPLKLQGGNVEIVPGCGWDSNTVQITRQMNSSEDKLNIGISVSTVSLSHFVNIILKRKPIKLKVTLFPKISIPGMGIPVGIPAVAITDDVDITIPTVKQPDIELDIKLTEKTNDGNYHVLVTATVNLPSFISPTDREKAIKTLTIDLGNQNNVSIKKGKVTTDENEVTCELIATPDFKTKTGTATVTIISRISLSDLLIKNEKQLSFDPERHYVLNINPSSLDVTMKKTGSLSAQVLQVISEEQKVPVNDATLSVACDSELVSVSFQGGVGKIDCTVSQQKATAEKQVSMTVQANVGTDSVKPQTVPINLETIDFGTLEWVFLPATKNHLNPYIKTDTVMIKATLRPTAGKTPVKADIEFACETPGGWLDGPNNYSRGLDPNSSITGPAETTVSLPFSEPVSTSPAVDGDNTKIVKFNGKVPDPEAKQEPPSSENVVVKVIFEGTVVNEKLIPIKLDPKPTLDVDKVAVNFLANAKRERSGRPEAIISAPFKLTVRNPGDEKWKFSVELDETAQKMVSFKEQDPLPSSDVFLFEMIDPAPFPEQKHRISMVDEQGPPAPCPWEQVVRVKTAATLGDLKIDGPPINITILHEGIYPLFLYECDKNGKLTEVKGKENITINVIDPSEVGARKDDNSPEDGGPTPFVTFIVMEWDGKGLVENKDLALDVERDISDIGSYNQPAHRSIGHSAEGQLWDFIFYSMREALLEVTHEGDGNTGNWHIILQKQIPGHGEKANGFVRFFVKDYFYWSSPESTPNWKYDLHIDLILGVPDGLDKRLSYLLEGARCRKIIDEVYPKQYREALWKELDALKEKGAEDYRRFSKELNTRAYNIWKQEHEDYLVWDARWESWINIAEKTSMAGDLAFNALVMVFTAPLGFVASLGLSTIAGEIKAESIGVYSYYVGQDMRPDFHTCMSDYVAQQWEEIFLQLLSGLTVELYLLKDFELKKLLTEPKKYGSMIASLWVWKWSVHIAKNIGTKNEGLWCSAKMATEDIGMLSLNLILAEFVGAHAKTKSMGELYNSVRDRGFFGGKAIVIPKEKLNKEQIKANQKLNQAKTDKKVKDATEKVDKAKAEYDAIKDKSSPKGKEAQKAYDKARNDLDNAKVQPKVDEAIENSKDDVNQADKKAFENGRAQGREKVNALQEAVDRLRDHPRDKNARRDFEHACEEVQKDKHAMHELNDIDPLNPNKTREAFNEHWKKTYEDVDEPVRQRIADNLNQRILDNLNQNLKPGEKTKTFADIKEPYTACDIEVVRPTNTPAGQTPGETSKKSTYDRDVTYGNLKTKDDISTEISRDIYNEEFYKNRHPDEKNPTKEQCDTYAKECDQAVTDRFDKDAYGGGKPEINEHGCPIRKDLGTATNEDFKGRPYKDVGATANTMKTKVDDWYNDATPEINKPGTPKKAAPTREKVSADKEEGMRQLTKQFDNQLEKVVNRYNELAGYPTPPIATIHPKVRTGVEIMKKIGKDGFTPADAEAALRFIGETPKTIADKMSGNLESGQKFMSKEQNVKMKEYIASLPRE